MAWTPIQNICGNVEDALELFQENPKTVIITLFILLIAGLSAWDIFNGQWITEDGSVVRKYEYTTWESHCTEYGKKGNCISSYSTPIQNYQIVVRHQSGTDDVNVMLFTYLQYSEKDPCQITYREGGVLGIHWFQSIKQEKV